MSITRQPRLLKIYSVLDDCCDILDHLDDISDQLEQLKQDIDDSLDGLSDSCSELQEQIVHTKRSLRSLEPGKSRKPASHCINQSMASDSGSLPFLEPCEDEVPVPWGCDSTN